MLKINKSNKPYWTNKSYKKIIITLLLFLITASVFGASDIIPAEVKTTFESVRDWVKDELAVVILGLLWVCSCIAYAFNKDSNRAKMAFLAVSISCVAIGLGLSVVEKFVSIGGK